MRKRPKKRIQTAPNSLNSSTQVWILFLLIALLVLTALDLYLDHYQAFTSESSEPIKQEENISDVNKAMPATGEAVSGMEPAPQQEEEKPQDTSTKSVLPGPSEIKVEVLNGCGVRGIASRVRGILRDRGFDVISFGNAKHANYTKSQIIVRTEGDLGQEAARVLAGSINIDAQQILMERDPKLVGIDVTLIIGRDYKELNF